MKSKCGTCKTKLGDQKRFCSRQCANVGANKARVVKMYSTRNERFWNKVNKTPDCWLWTAYTGKHGYGVLKFDGKVDLAHRVAWNISRPNNCDGLCVLHTCDNPPCVRPDHLFLGTKQDNSDDMFDKGRNYHPAGENSATAKLTYEEVEHIRGLRGKLKQVDIAKMFGINQPHVSRILRGKSWKRKH